MKENKFDFDVISTGSFVDQGYRITVVTIRLNRTALAEYNDTKCLDCWGLYSEVERNAYKQKQKQKMEQFEKKVARLLDILLPTDTSKESFSCTQAVSEIFTVVRMVEEGV